MPLDITGRSVKQIGNGRLALAKRCTKCQKITEAEVGESDFLLYALIGAPSDECFPYLDEEVKRDLFINDLRSNPTLCWKCNNELPNN